MRSPIFWHLSNQTGISAYSDCVGNMPDIYPVPASHPIFEFSRPDSDTAGLCISILELRQIGGLSEEVGTSNG